MNIVREVAEQIRHLKESNRLDSLRDVDHSGVRDLSVLQYDDTQSMWVARAEDEFFDATIDGGFADTLHLEVFDIDGGFA